jgi:hypothetical protein
VTRSAQDDDFVVSWKMQKQPLLEFLVSAAQISVDGAAPFSSAHVRWGEHGAPVQESGHPSSLDRSAMMNNVR